MERKEVKSILEKNKDLRKKLYNRGFIFTNQYVDTVGYPFYNLWNFEEVESYYLGVSSNQKYYVYKEENIILILIGHAYNPFNNEFDEMNILKSLVNQIKISKNSFFDEINCLTGLFTIFVIKNKDIEFLIGDPTGMQTTFYYSLNNKICVSSHVNLIADFFELNQNEYIEKLIDYKFFSLLGNSLPGDLTKYDYVKRLTPNHYISFKNNSLSISRFYYPHRVEKTHDEIVNEVSKIMKNNMILISKKWEKPAISMTGGCDSKTTLSCANGIYDKFSYFSYVSSESEKVDAIAAHKLCDSLNLKHRIDMIPSDNAQNFEDISKIIRWNTGDILPIHANDVRKRIFYDDTELFDVEVKSWASEIGRSYFSKRFNGRKNFGRKATPRKCTTLYKFFLHNRRLVLKTDKVFKEYLEKYFCQDSILPISWQEQFFWEFRVPSWNGNVITGEHRYSYDITIPYNNRIILNLLASVSIDDRINDTVYHEIREAMNPDIDKTGISITNLKHTNTRAKIENLYYILNTHII